MAMTTPNKVIPVSTQVGIPGFETDSYGAGEPLVTGSKEITTGVEKVGASTTLAAYSVVGRDGSGNLVLANLTGPIVPVGILTVAVTTGVGVSTTVEVFKSGIFNPDALTWHADYDTAAKKAVAFEGSKASEIQLLGTKFKSLV